MKGLNPSFFRFPGGNNLEGNEPPYWWDWKKTLGPLENRPGYPGTWTYENTDGLGLLEYLLWSEDLGMVSKLMGQQGNSKQVVAMWRLNLTELTLGSKPVLVSDIC